MTCLRFGEDADGLRLDVCAAESFEITRNTAQKLIKSGHILLNSGMADKKTRVKAGDECILNLPEPVPSSIEAENIPLTIVYEDSELLVVNKSRGMVVHPAPGHYCGTLVNALMFHCGQELSGINGVLRPGIVHRIDKDTSGILVVAKTDRAHVSLASQLGDHSMIREYNAIAHGVVQPDCLTINKPIGRHFVDRKRMAVTDRNSKAAITHIRVLRRFKRFSHIQANLETGRTHQIRVHLSHIGHPLLGDEVYGAKNQRSLGGQMLHAKKLGFSHPVTDEKMLFETELPTYFKDVLESRLG